MENIVSLTEYRNRRRRPKVEAPPQARYFCTRCEADEFRIAATGTVHCAHCSALMRNLLVNN